ncbi:MAG: hypothetical protein SFY96_06055 [Planctomycetota bacterium]|nr:hypothetical protein [Planctomycetota bacterium]
MSDFLVQQIARVRAALQPLARSSPGLCALVDAPAAQHAALIDAFADDAGHRRRIDRPLLADLLGVRLPSPALSAAAALDERLWWAVHDSALPTAAIAAELGPRGEPLIGRATPLVIETATETELGALHALWTIARRRDDATLRARCLDAARYLIAELQPDNATNHPWASDVFLTLAEQGEPAIRPDALLYAQTLLHNCQVQLGRPDSFSAALLLHAATR